MWLQVKVELKLKAFGFFKARPSILVFFPLSPDANLRDSWVGTFDRFGFFVQVRKATSLPANPNVGSG